MSLTTRQSIDEIYLMAKQKMQALGYAHYTTKSRNIKLAANAALIINGSAEYWFLRSELYGVDIESDYGISGQQRVNYNELVNIHTGKITINNNTPEDLLIEFVQVLPKRK